MAESGTVRDLLDEVAFQVRRLFEAGLERFAEAGLTRRAAMKLFAVSEGATLMASAMDDTTIFDQAMDSSTK